MADQAPLITPELQATIGQRGKPRLSEVDKLQIRLFARSVGHTDPIFYDEDEAKKAGYKSLVAPPGYLGTPIFDPGQNDALAIPMGGGSGPQPSRPLNRVLNGGTEIEYFDDIVAGDVLEAVGYTSDIQERSGSIGQMMITTNKTEYTRKSDGKIVAIATGTGIRY